MPIHSNKQGMTQSPENDVNQESLHQGDQHTVKRILLVMMQPPGSSGVQGLIYNKILPYLEAYGWEFHFAGPEPELASVMTETVDCPQSRMHYTQNISWSHRFSVLKNRQRKKSASYFFYGLCQFMSRGLEKITGHDSRSYLLHGLRRTVMTAEKEWQYDLIAGKSPDFPILETVADLTRTIKKPLVAMVVDPHGKRDRSSFTPYQPQQQQRILDQCCGAMFMSPLTLERYVESGLVSADKAYFFTDSFPSSVDLYQQGKSPLVSTTRLGPLQDGSGTLRLAHLGMLPEWRPIDALLQAVDATKIPVSIDIFGYLYPAAQQQILSNPSLRSQIRCHNPVSYLDSHCVAEDASAILVVIGPRHLDNLPSKFFEYLGHRKPVFVVGPLGNPIQQIVEDLQIGLYCDVNSAGSIQSGFEVLSSNYDSMIEAFDFNQTAINRYSASQVAKHWCDCLDKMLSASSEEQIH
jgi:hypothetical protein